MYYTAVPQRLCFTSASSGCFDDMLFVLAQNLLESLPAFLPACIRLQPGPESRVWCDETTYSYYVCPLVICLFANIFTLVRLVLHSLNSPRQA